MWIFIAEIGVAIYFYVGNIVKQKKQKETIVSFFFYDIIFDDSIGGLVINSLIGEMKMRFNYTCRITYGSGQCCDRSRQQLTIEIIREQYGRIIEKVTQGCTISEVPGIEELVKDMKE